MEYTDLNGQPAHGEVWSPGPLPGSVWVLPYNGARASEARAVSIRHCRELSTEDVRRRRNVWNFDYRAHESDADRRLPAKGWHTALGYDPRDIVQQAETLPLDIPA